MTDLLPCPFCGDSDIRIKVSEICCPIEYSAYASCSSCGCESESSAVYADVEEAKLEAIDAWNNRYYLTPTDGLLASMALRYRHDFGILPADEQRTIMAIMRQIHEEVVGKGFYSVKDEDKFKRALNYGAMDELSKIDQELGLYDES